MESNQRDQVDIRVLIEEVCAAFTVRAERKNVNLNISTDSYMPKILGNEEQLRRVLTNLLDNALKHTPQGGDVNTEMQFMKADGIIYISVTDTGRGIAEKHLPHIFERFYRVEATLPRVNRLPGSGLGLAIAKSIVELHNGEISVTSEMFKGATFHIRLPVV
jgi:signal transduction histidine kinase